jgi:hypothetical protein
LSIVTYQSLYARFARAQAEAATGKRSKYLRYRTAGAPTVYFAYGFEDWGMVNTVARALATCGVDIHADLSAGSLFKKGGDSMERLRGRLGMPDAWLVALLSERTKDFDRLTWVLDVARETTLPGRYALLPVRYEADDWILPREFVKYPRIETHRNELVRVSPGAATKLPLSRWLRTP